MASEKRHRGSFLPKRHFYRRIWIIVLFITSMQGLLTSLAIYWLARENIGNELLKLHHNQIQQRAENIDEQFAYLEMMVVHWAFDSKFDESLSNLDFRARYSQILDLYRTLLVIEGAHPLIAGVELYLDTPRPFLMNKDQYRFLEEEQDIAPYRRILAQNKQIVWNQGFTHKLLPNEDNAIALFKKVPGGSTNPLGFLAISLSEARLLRLLQTLTPYNEGTTFITSADSGWTISTSTGESRQLDQLLQERVRDNPEQSGSFLFKYGDTAYSVSSGQFTRLGTTWTYVSAAPMTALTKPVYFISRLFFLVSLGGLLSAVVLSWLASYRLYSPVGNLMEKLRGDPAAGEKQEKRDEFDWILRQWSSLSTESKDLRLRLQDQMQLVRENFLMQLVQGYHYSLQEQELRTRLNHYGWETAKLYYLIVNVQLSGIAETEGRFARGDEDLITFAAANITKELAAQTLDEYEVLNFHDLSLSLLAAVPESAEERQARQEIRRFSENLAEVIRRILKLKVSLSISRLARQAGEIPFLFEESRQLLRYRQIADTYQIMDQTEMDVSGPRGEELKYPYMLEKEIIRAIQLGSDKEAMHHLERFIDEMRQKNTYETVLQHALLQLLGSIMHALMQSGINTLQLYCGANLYGELAGCKDREDQLEWFRHCLVQPVIKELDCRQNSQVKKLVEQTIMILESRYMMTDLSLEVCADELGTNMYTLSKVFKQVTGENFVDCLSRVRLEHAKRMLLESDMKISDIADQVGYQQSYFIRVFKKLEGVTPGQFRETRRNTSSQAEE